MKQFGFEVTDTEDVTEAEVELGMVEELHTEENTEHWTDGMGEYFFETFVKFCVVYGGYAAIRDLVRSLF
ncbi:MAG: hypothetical protein HQ510_10615 [Candidatus Marinimicrobia bacterium]|nr:hypothetical protein [Candidatus Neomarinimicrobiota bacterium]